MTALANEALDNTRNSEDSSADERKEPTPKETDCRIGVQRVQTHRCYPQRQYTENSDNDRADSNPLTDRNENSDDTE